VRSGLHISRSENPYNAALRCVLNDTVIDERIGAASAIVTHPLRPHAPNAEPAHRCVKFPSNIGLRSGTPDALT
jgi:hypothetical protein